MACERLLVHRQVAIAQFDMFDVSMSRLNVDGDTPFALSPHHGKLTPGTRDIGGDDEACWSA
jgi:hypothetical protein